MSDNQRFHDIVKAVALGDTNTAQSLGRDLGSDEHTELGIFASAVMAVCLDHRFREDSSVDAIRAFVNEMRRNFADAEPPLKFLAIEGVIRGFAGEEDLLDEISPEDQVAANYPVIRKIVSDSPELQAKLDAVMHDADLLAAEWKSEA